jgi:uncharacterized protein YjiS (DUF1127 family)
MTAAVTLRVAKTHSLTRIGFFLRLWRRTCEEIAKWDPCAREREGLVRLNDHLLADMGLTREKQIVERSMLLYWLQLFELSRIIGKPENAAPSAQPGRAS